MENKSILNKTWMISLLMAVFISYPNLAWLTCDITFIPDAEHARYLLHFVGRFLYIWATMYVLLWVNFRKLEGKNLIQRLLPTAAVALVAYGIYDALVLILRMPYDRFLMVKTFQFSLMAVTSAAIGYMAFLYTSRQEKEDELQQLRIESLQSRCNALTNQINPHFFFNSLNGIIGLVRKNDNGATIDYINELSDIFRYILQSENEGLVTLEEELDFVSAYAQVLQVRYASKMAFEVNVPDAYKQCRLPVLSLLPVLENVPVHNMIDSDHRMVVSIGMTDDGKLKVSNTSYPKICKPETHGTGLKNLNKRFLLLTDNEICSAESNGVFNVILPLV